MDEYVGQCAVCGDPIDHTHAGFCEECGQPFCWGFCGSWQGGKHVCNNCQVANEDDE